MMEAVVQKKFQNIPKLTKSFQNKILFFFGEVL